MNITGSKKLLIVFAALLLLCGAVFFFVLPAQVEKRMNAVINRPPYQASEKARALHQRLFVADLHADSLLWNRNLLEGGTRGHVDVPRLIEGNVALQAFTVVTKTPRGMNIESNSADTDNITLLAVASGWPVATWSSLKERALYQAARLRQMAAASGGKLTLIETARDLSNYLERRKREPHITAGFLGLEGAHALDGDLANLDALFDAGFRMMSPTHFFDNEIGGSSSGAKKTGLTDAGRELIKRMEAKGMIVDLAHASAQTIEDILAVSTRPVLVSHTGVKATCDNNRNISDEQIEAIAKTGGIIGIGYWPTATCGADAQAIAHAIKHVATLVGAQHVALGSDFDGAITAPFDTTGLVQITDELLKAGFTEDETSLMMGGNVLRLLSESLPQ